MLTPLGNLAKKTSSKEMREYLKGREDCQFADSEAEEVGTRNFSSTDK